MMMKINEIKNNSYCWVYLKMTNLELAKLVIDHRKTNAPDARSVYELQLEMAQEDPNASKFKWVPFTDFYK